MFIIRHSDLFSAIPQNTHQVETIFIVWYINHRAYDVRTQLSHLNVSVNSNWVHPPGNPRGLAQKIVRGSGFDFRKFPGGREFDKGRDFVEIQSETFCPCIGFISDKYRVSQNLLKNGEHYIVDFQFKLR